MEKKGLVIWSWGNEQSGPRRKYYDITPYGKTVLEKDWRFHEQLKQYQVASENLSSQPEAPVDSTALTDIRHLNTSADLDTTLTKISKVLNLSTYIGHLNLSKLCSSLRT